MKQQLYNSIADLFDQQKYDSDWNIKQPELAASKSQGRKGANFIEYFNEVGTNQQEPFNLDEPALESRLRDFEAFLQPDQAFQVFIPKLCLKGFFSEIMRGTPPMEAYKGVSYNPSLITNGEKLDNVDFFAWAKRVQAKLPDFELTILDASPYQVINQIETPTVPKSLRDEEVADWFYSMIEQGVAADSQLQENCRLRSMYLRALLAATGVKGKVISALDLIKARDPALLSAFEEARQICGMRSSSEGLLQTDKFVTYRRYGQEFAKTYTPAVVAEALYFLNQNGVKAKLGPTSEMAFDKIISETMQGKSPYDFFWYSRPFEKGGNRENRLYLKDEADEVRRKLTADPNYAIWVNGVLEPFSSELQVQDRVMEVIGKVNKIVTSM